MSFYPRLFEEKESQHGRTFLRDKLVDEFKDKYIHHSRESRIKNKTKIPIEQLVDDIKFIAKKYNLNIDLNSIKILEPMQGAEHKLDVSSMYKSVMFKINGKYKNIVFAGAGEGGQTTRTYAVFKEGLTIYFIKSKYKYEPFSKNSTEEYTKLFQSLIDDIEKNKIQGVNDTDVKSIINTLKNEIGSYNQSILNNIFNAMSIGNKLRETQFSNWDTYRNEFFNKIKKEAATDLNFKGDEIDKWCPMDFILIKPGNDTKEKIEKQWDIAKNKETEILKIGDYNNIFVDNLNTHNDNELILAISLKEENSQHGWGKSYLRRIEKVKDNYNLTSEEQKWSTEKLMSEIVNERKKAPQLISALHESEFYSYDLENPIDGFKNADAAKAKYGSLKLLNYLLSKIPEENLFINLATYTLGLGKNPPFFIFEGNESGNSSTVEITKRKQTGGASLYNVVTKDHDGKIHIKDSNSSAGIEITYFIEIEEELNKVDMYIRTTTGIKSKANMQVNIAVRKIKKIKNLSESFYPRLHEKFTEDSDPIADMNIGMMHQIKLWMESINQPFKNKDDTLVYSATHGKLDFVEYLLAAGADAHNFNDSALRWTSNNGHTEVVKVLLAAGADVHANNDYALRWASGSGHTEVVKILLDAGADVHADNDNALRWASIHGRTEVVKVLKDHIAKEKKVKESLNEKFTEDDSDPIHDMGIGLHGQIDNFIKEHDVDKDVINRVLTPAMYIAEINGLDNKIKKEWIEFLLREGKEDFSMWSEYSVDDMISAGVEFIPHVKHLPDENFWYKRQGENYTLFTSEWNNFSPYFIGNREIDEKTIETILSGEGYNDIFDPAQYSYYPFHDILDNFSDKEKIKVFNKLKPICLKHSDEIKDVKELTELFYIIDKNPDFYDIKVAIKNSAENVLAGAAEEDAYKDIQRAIEKNYHMTYVKYTKDKLVLKITKDGLNKFFTAFWINDYKINYYPPQYGWSGDFNVDYFLEDLEQYLS